MIVFDLDGVLVDPSRALSVAWARVSSKFGLEIDEKLFRSWVGTPLAEVLMQLDLSDSARSEIRDLFEHEMLKQVDVVDPYPQVIEGLAELHRNSSKVAVFTSKPRLRALHACDRIGLASTLLVTPDDLPLGEAKPSPEGLFRIASLTGNSLSEIVFLGDSPADLAAARGAGVTFFHATWGFHALPQDTLGFVSVPSFGDFVKYAKRQCL